MSAIIAAGVSKDRATALTGLLSSRCALATVLTEKYMDALEAHEEARGL